MIPTCKQNSTAKRKLSSISSVHVGAKATRSNMIKFGDVHDVLSPFTGDDHCLVVKWLNDFDVIALRVLCTSLKLHKFVYCKRLLGNGAGFL